MAMMLGESSRQKRIVEADQSGGLITYRWKRLRYIEADGGMALTALAAEWYNGSGCLRFES